MWLARSVVLSRRQSAGQVVRSLALRGRQMFPWTAAWAVLVTLRKAPGGGPASLFDLTAPVSPARDPSPSSLQRRAAPVGLVGTAGLARLSDSKIRRWALSGVEILAAGAPMPAAWIQPACPSADVPTCRRGHPRGERSVGCILGTSERLPGRPRKSAGGSRTILGEGKRRH